MKLLEDKILSDGIILNGDILKIDNFLNHQIDVELLDQMGQEFKKLYSDSKINKILTIESSGIGIAVMAARYFNNCPVVYAKKASHQILVAKFMSVWRSHILVMLNIIFKFLRDI